MLNKIEIAALYVIDLWDRHFICALASLIFGLYAFTYAGNPFGPPIRSDGIGYYIYLPAFVIYGDPSFNQIVDEHFDGFIPGYTGVALYAETGRHFNKYNCGVAIFGLPFFLLAHLFTFILRTPPGGADWLAYQYAMDGMSPLYGHAVAIGGAIYFLMGCILLRNWLRRQCSSRLSSATVGLLVIGTNLWDVGGATSFSTHSIGLFLFASFLWVFTYWSKQPRNTSWTVVLGVIIGSIVLVRLTNLLILLVLALYPLVRWREIGNQVRLSLIRWPQFLLMGLVALLVFFPQMLFWKYSTGQWIFNSYGSRGLPHLADPALFDVLFSVQKGVFVWTPVLAMVIPGLFLMKRVFIEWRWAIAVLLLFQLYVIASAAVWDAGACFGQRYFSEYLVFAALPMVAFISSWRTQWQRLAGGLFICTCVTWTLFLMKLYYTREISVYGLDSAALYDVFWWRFQALRDWWVL